MAYSSHFSDSGDYSDYRWETFMVLHPGPDLAPAVPGLAHYSSRPTFTDARLLAEAMEVRVQRILSRAVHPALVVWVEAERDGSCFDGHPDAYESTTVCRETGQLSLLDYRSTPNLRTC